MENGDSAHSEHTHRSSNNAGHDFVYGTRSLCTLREEPEENFLRLFLFPRHRLRLHTNPLTAPCEHIAKKFVAKNFA
jgi:hypothetical protein